MRIKFLLSFAVALFFPVFLLAQVVVYENKDTLKITEETLTPDGKIVTTTVFEKQSVFTNGFWYNWELTAGIGPHLYYGDNDWKVAKKWEMITFPVIDIDLTKWISPSFGIGFGVSTGRFLLHMLPLCALSAVLLVVFVFALYRKDPRERIEAGAKLAPWKPEGRIRRVVYLVLFLLIIGVIVSRTSLWPFAVLVVLGGILAVDRKLLLEVDYVLIFTFLCFFVFSSSIAANEGIAAFLQRAVANHEYWWAIGLSQLISNVPASIVLYPFTENFAGNTPETGAGSSRPSPSSAGPSSSWW